MQINTWLGCKWLSLTSTGLALTTNIVLGLKLLSLTSTGLALPQILDKGGNDQQ
jgi:hypothetical protein